MYAALKSLPAGSIEDEIYSALSIAPNIHRASGASPPGGIRATAWFDWRTCGAYPPISTVIKSNKGKRDDRFRPTKCHVGLFSIYISLFLVRISVSLLRSLSIINLCSRFFSIRGVHISRRGDSPRSVSLEREGEGTTDSWTNTWASRIQRREIPRHAEARVWWKKEVGVVFLFFLHASRDRAREDSFYRNRYYK